MRHWINGNLGASIIARNCWGKSCRRVLTGRCWRGALRRYPTTSEDAWLKHLRMAGNKIDLAAWEDSRRISVNLMMVVRWAVSVETLMAFVLISFGAFIVGRKLALDSF
ncbi:hypothetical protein TRFO_03591 [Tritrichomonas foetus]|uniref:Uncharacterized protein n=1 Tax=Tritrichomonas foetus TaxID=1144522 RepID=A0A1J4KMP3_9EUKA|nr:hypothetical protein TRFO_03591 [Tritrichomonas foetus]|eukprot:OHT12583.1 hypothetical protein TRFO_03591 [Tritrichomonas foetus]